MGRNAGARHLYVHVPFCEHRCGYCDFVTAVGRSGQHGAYVDAVLHELDLQSNLLADELETVYVGGGTPTYLEFDALARLLCALPAAAEVTVEANPETVTPSLAALLATHGVNRISLGAQTFQPELLETLERRASPTAVRASVPILRAAGFENLSLDLIYGIPGQSVDDLAHDLDCLVELAPEHVSAYELEAKPGTRFVHAHGAELERQAAQMEDHMERVTETLQSSGYHWYETASFYRAGSDLPDTRSRHNRGYWLGHDYLGIGVGAVSTIGERRWQNHAGLGRYLTACRAGDLPPSSEESISPSVRLWERAMLGLRLEEGVDRALVAPVLDPTGLERMVGAGLVEADAERIRLSPRGRMLGGAVTVELLLDGNETSAAAPSPGALVAAGRP